MPTTTTRSTPTPAQSAAAAADIAAETLDAQTLRRVVFRLSRRLRVSTADGLTPSQLSCLSSVVRHGPLRAGDLAGRERINPTSLSRIIGRLEELGFIERTPDPNDRRGAILVGTASAQAEIGHIEAERDALLLASLQQLTDDQQRTVRAALPALEALLGAVEAGTPTTTGSRV